MQMTAVVINTNQQGMLVRNEANNENVRVIYRNSRRFGPGDRVRITYSGVITLSIPPQITATNVQLLGTAPRPPFVAMPPLFNPPRPPLFIPREMRVTVLRTEQGFLIVRNNANNQILRVDTPDARFFCPGRQAVVRFNTIIPGLPPRVDLVEIMPLC